MTAHTGTRAMRPVPISVPIALPPVFHIWICDDLDSIFKSKPKRCTQREWAWNEAIQVFRLFSTKCWVKRVDYQQLKINSSIDLSKWMRSKHCQVSRSWGGDKSRDVLLDPGRNRPVMLRYKMKCISWPGDSMTPLSRPWAHVDLAQTSTQFTHQHLDWPWAGFITSLSPSFLYVQNEGKICLFINEVMCTKISGIWVLREY